MNKGKFLVLYGSNNSGKSVQIKMLVDWLCDRGINAVQIKYPIYATETGQMINEILRPPEGQEPLNLPEEYIQWLFAENRRLYEPELREMLENGVWPVGEDYKDTGKAWGLTRGVDREFLDKINGDLLEPDWSALLESRERFTSGIEKNHRHEGLGDEMWERNRQIHHELAVESGYPIIEVVKDNEMATHQRVMEELLKSGCLG